MKPVRLTALTDGARRLGTLVRAAGLLVELVVERALVDGVALGAHRMLTALAIRTRRRDGWTWAVVAVAALVVVVFLSLAAR